MKIMFMGLILFAMVGCTAGGVPINWYDGTWSMCKTSKDGEMISNTPVPSGNLPPGVGATIKGVTIACTPIAQK